MRRSTGGLANFVDTYMQESEGELPAVIAYMRNTLATEVIYYGKRTSRQQVIEEKRKYLTRWPQRTFQLKSETIHVECDDKQPVCRIVGELDYRTANPADSRMSSGAASFELRVQFSRTEARIIEESGRVLARAN